MLKYCLHIKNETTLQAIHVINASFSVRLNLPIFIKLMALRETRTISANGACEMPLAAHTFLNDYLIKFFSINILAKW